MLRAKTLKPDMKISELRQHLAAHAELALRFHLPDGAPIAAHAHVTEVARIDKRFVDCGGTLRTDAFCRLQTWVADDTYHRLTAGKLHSILEKAKPVLLSDDLDVDIEHENGVLSQYPLGSVELSGNELVLRLNRRHTACLAEDRCIRPPTAANSIFFKPLPRFT